MKTPSRNDLLATAARLAGVASVLTLSAPLAHAALTWSATGLTNNWSTASGNENWDAGVVWTQNEDAVFDASSGTPEAINATTANIFNDITFDVSGFSVSSSGAGSLALSNDLASTITVTNAADSASIAETIANNGGGASSLTKAGAGTLILNGTAANTWSGGTNVNAGTLVSSQATNIALLGTGPVTVGASGTVRLENTSTTVDTAVANTFTGNGNAEVASIVRGFNVSGDWSGFTGTFSANTTSGGKVNFTGTPFPSSAIVNVASGATFYATGKAFTNDFNVGGTGNTENRGALRLDSGSSISGDINLTADATLGVTSNPASIISGIISGGFGLRTAPTGGGTLVLSGNNSYSGKTILAGQTIFSVSAINNAGINGNLGTNATIEFGATGTGGTLVYTGAGETTDRSITLAGTTGGATITQSASSGQLEITGNVLAPGTAAADNRKTLTLNGSASGTGRLAGNVSNSLLGTAGQLTTTVTKNGTGTWTLAGNNTHTGGTNASGGTLVAASAGALGAAGAISNFGATGVVLELATDSSINAVVLNQGSNLGAGILRLSRATSGPAFTQTLGNFTMGINNNITVEAGSNIASGTPTVSFAQWQLTSGSGNGNSTLSPTSANVTLGGITIPSGNTLKTAVLDGTSTGNVVTGATVSGPLASAVLSLLKSNSSTWTLAGANSHTGSTTVNGGTLRLAYSSQDNSKLGDAAALILGGGTVELVDGTHTETVGSTTLTSGTVSSLTRSSGTAVLQLNTVTPNTGALNFSADGLATTDNPNVNGILPWARFGTGWGSNSTGGADGPIVAYSGAYSNVDRLGGTIPNGIANHVKIVNGGTPGNIALATSPNRIASIIAEASDGPAVIDPSNPGDILLVGEEPGGTIWQPASSGGLTIGATAGDGILTTGNTANATAATLTLLNDSATNPLTVNAAIANNGSDVVSVTKGGSGSVLLAGDNSFTGSLTAAGGPLVLSGNNSTATGAFTAAAGGTLVLSGNNSTRPAATNGRTVAATGGILQLQANPNNTAAGISYALSAEQTANQPLNLLSGSTLQLRSDSSLTFAGGNNLGGLGSATVTIDVNSLSSGSGNILTIAPAGFAVNTTTLNVTGGNGHTLATGPINNGTTGATLTLNPTTADLRIAGYTVGASAATTLALTGSANDSRVTGAIANPATSGNTTVTKSGTGTWTLEGINTYAGATTINAGTLAIGASGSLGNGNYAGTIANAGALIYDSSATQTLSGVISGAGTLTVNGAGNLTLGGASANTYTGVTTLNAGITIAGKASAFGGTGATAGTIVNPTALLDVNSQDLGTEQFTLAGGTIKNNGPTDQANATRRVNVTADSSVGGTRRWDVRGGGLGGLTVQAGAKLTKVDANLVGVVTNPVVNNGTIQIDNGLFGLHLSAAASGSGSFVVNSGGELQIGSYGGAVTVANPITVNGGILAGVSAQTAVSSYNGPITLSPATTATLRAEANFNITAAIGGAGGLNKTGTGTLTISAASNHGGDTTVSAGTLSYTVPSSFADASAVRLITGAVLNLDAEGTDTIGTFYIDGIPQDSGTWGAIGSGAEHETALITGPGLLDASSGGSPFAAWIDSFFPGETDPAIIGLTADPDNDGTDNFTEFAFDGAPDDGADHAKVYVFTADSDFDGDSAEELILTAAIRTSTPAFGNGSPTSSTSTTDGITYSIEGSTTLVDFLESVNAVPTAITLDLPALSGPDYSYRSFRLGGSNGLPGKGFLRARATAP